MANGDDPRERRTSGGRGKVIALVFLVVLAGFAVWLINGIIADVRLQNCVSSGRRDCVPIVPDGGGR